MRYLHILIAVSILTTMTPGQGDKTKLEIPQDKDPVTTDSGLKYSVLREGDGKLHPKLNDEVEVHYTGWLENGKIFDSSVQRGTPAKFRLGQVIQGWNEGLTKITKGARLKLTIPPKLGYGAQPNGEIPANSTLIFEVELLGLNPVPAYTEADKKSQVKLGDDVAYQVITPGTGEAVGADGVASFRYAVWDESKKLIDCSDFRPNEVKVNCANAPLPFMKQVLPLMKAGSKWRVDVKAAAANGRAGVWYLELLKASKPLAVPEFKLPTEDELETTETGLQLKNVETGEGASPTRQSRVSCHYAGWRKKDGVLFDSSFSRGEPTPFPVAGVIPGWTEALLRMKPGGKMWLVIPSKLAYGARGAGPKIGPNEDLVFYIELIEVK